MTPDKIQWWLYSESVMNDIEDCSMSLVTLQEETFSEDQMIMCINFYTRMNLLHFRILLLDFEEYY